MRMREDVGRILDGLLKIGKKSFTVKCKLRGASELINVFKRG